MPRSLVSTRLAAVADVPAMVTLWSELRRVGGRAERAVNPVNVPDIAQRLAEAVAGDDCDVVLACVDGEPSGMAICRPVYPDPLSDSRVLQVTNLIVAPGNRRRGVGRALLAAAADIAEGMHVEHVGVGIYPSMRDASRFYARLGFAPVLIHRIAPVSVLRRRLGASEGGLPKIEELVRRRSRVRRPLPAQRPGRGAAAPGKGSARAAANAAAEPPA